MSNEIREITALVGKSRAQQDWKDLGELTNPFPINTIQHSAYEIEAVILLKLNEESI